MAVLRHWLCEPRATPDRKRNPLMTLAKFLSAAGGRRTAATAKLPRPADFAGLFTRC